MPVWGNATPFDFSIVRGGPWFRAEQRLGLEARGGPIWPPVSRLVAALIVGWLPLFLLAWSKGQGPGGVDSLFADRRAMAQTLFAIPILIAAEPYVDGRIAAAALRPLLLRLLGAADRGRYSAVLARSARWRDSAWAQAAALSGAFVLSAAQLTFGIGKPFAFSPPGQTLTPVGAWYFAVSLPLFWLLAILWLWRLLVWSAAIVGLSRLELRIASTHADRTGGLKYLANAQASFAPVVFGLGCWITATTRPESTVDFTGDLVRYAGAQAVYAAICFTVLNLPLLALSPKLLVAKRRSDAHFAELMARQARAFEQRWFDLQHRRSPLAAPDSSSQIDLSSSFELAERMRWVPWGFRATLAILAAAMLSLVPRLVMQHELLEALMDLAPKIF